jgi:hypothetical protein
MAIKRKPKCTIFGKIKQTLDPAYSYLIFQKAAGKPDEDEFYAIFDAIARLELAILEWKIYHDESESVALLVVKVNPERTDKILAEFVNEGMPKDIFFYSLGSRVGV